MIPRQFSSPITSIHPSSHPQNIHNLHISPEITCRTYPPSTIHSQTHRTMLEPTNRPIYNHQSAQRCNKQHTHDHYSQDKTNSSTRVCMHAAIMMIKPNYKILWTTYTSGYFPSQQSPPTKHENRSIQPREKPPSSIRTMQQLSPWSKPSTPHQRNPAYFPIAASKGRSRASISKSQNTQIPTVTSRSTPR